MSFSFLLAPAFPLCFLVSNQWVLAEPGLTGEPAGFFSSSFALGLIQANGESQFIMHLLPLPPVKKLQCIIRLGESGIIAIETANKSFQYPIKELRAINICLKKKMCPDHRRSLVRNPRMQN